MNILITGATKGIGKSVALEMAKNGYSLAVCARDSNALESLEKELLTVNANIVVLAVKADCSIKAEVIAFADKVVEVFGNVDVLVNNVGVFSPSSILKENDDQLSLHFKTNVEAPYLLYKKLAPLMTKNGKGHIFNICSIASTQTIVDAGSYCVTKAALLSLNNIMREETKPFGLKVTAILPGSTLTASWDGVEVSPDKFVQPDDVAKCINQIMQLSAGANVDQLIITPQNGQV